MSFVFSLVSAIAAAAALIAASRIWFGRVQKRRHAERIGIEALSARHWREPLGLLVEALADEGFTAQADLAGGHGAPLGERILRRGPSTVLLIYKHGTAYRIGAAALLDAEKRRQEASIDEVMIATLGSVDAEARGQAERMRITCRDGAAIWSLLRERLDASTLAAVDAEAEQLIDRPRRLSTLCAAVLGLAIVFWGGGLDERLSGAGFELAGPHAEATPAATPAAEAVPATLPAPTPGTSPAAEAVGPAPPSEQRVAVAKALGALPEIDRASWSSGSTLVISVSPRSDTDAAYARACALAPTYPVLREARLQFETEGGANVRWRRCT